MDNKSGELFQILLVGSLGIEFICFTQQFQR